MLLIGTRTQILCIDPVRVGDHANRSVNKDFAERQPKRPRQLFGASRIKKRRSECFRPPSLLPHDPRPELELLRHLSVNPPESGDIPDQMMHPHHLIINIFLTCVKVLPPFVGAASIRKK